MCQECSLAFTSDVLSDVAGQQVTELAMQNSVSAVVARIRARSCGTPMPFASQVPVQNSESGRGDGVSSFFRLLVTSVLAASGSLVCVVLCIREDTRLAASTRAWAAGQLMPAFWLQFAPP